MARSSPSGCSRRSPGNERMQEISGAVQEGAKAYLNRQYMIIGVVAVPLAILIAMIQDVDTGIGFVIGGALSGAAGFIGMNVSVRANARVAEAAEAGSRRRSTSPSRAARSPGCWSSGWRCSASPATSGSCVLTDHTDKEAVDALIGLGFGGSLISVFARLGGGIFTKAADVGADLVGKVEAGIPEDDPRNPAVIADNVGDNVGDCAGMAADLFETYAVTTVAVMLLGVLTFAGDSPARSRCTRWSSAAVAILASIVGALAVRTRRTRSRARCTAGLIVSAVIRRRRSTRSPMADERPLALESAIPASARRRLASADLWLCALIGLVVTGGLFVITDYYTSTRFRPVKTIAAASQTGHATNIIQGLAQGFQSTAAPALLIALAIFGANELAGIYGIAIAVDGAALALRPDRRARRVRPDHRQRRRHRRDGGAARGRPQRHRPARRGRQHDEGRHQGLRDRLRRARRAGAVRRLQDRAGARRRPASMTASSISTTRPCSSAC